MHQVATAAHAARPSRGWARRVGPFMAAAAIGVAALTGCGSSSSNNSSSSTSGTSATSAAGSSPSSSDNSSNTTNVSAFVQAVQTQPHFQGISTDNLTKLGNAVCSDFSQGASLNQVEQDSVQAVQQINANDEESGNNPGGNLDQHDAGFLIGAAIKGLCPQYSDQIPNS